jgi:hypothetical protein
MSFDDDSVQLLAGGKPPVAVAAIIGIIQGFNKVFGIINIPWFACIATVGSRIGVVPEIFVILVTRLSSF